MSPKNAGLWLITSYPRKNERKIIRDVKVVKIECIKQHRLLICVFDLKERVGQCKVKPVKRCKVWKLNRLRQKASSVRECRQELFW